jgi:hypothetical protein
MRFFRRKVKVTPYELGKVLAALTFSRSDMNQLKEILRNVGDFVSVKEGYLGNSHKEWFMMNMFGVVRACKQTIPNDKCNAVLEAYRLHIHNRLSYVGWNYRQIAEFEILLNRRYKDYQQTLRIKNPPGRLYYLGQYAAQHMFAEEYSDNHYAIITSSRIFACTVKAAEKMIRKTYELI